MATIIVKTGATNFTPGTLVPIFPRHPVISITVTGAPSEFTIQVGNKRAGLYSTNGVLLMKDVATANYRFKELQLLGRTQDNTGLSDVQNDEVINFEAVWGVYLLFKTPLPSGTTYPISWKYYKKKGIKSEAFSRVNLRH